MNPSVPPTPALGKRSVTAPVVLVFVLLALLSVLAWFLTSRFLAAQHAADFAHQSEQIAALIQERMDTYSQSVLGLQGLFDASESVSDAEWQAYVGSIDFPRNFAGVSSVRYLPRVMREQVDAYPYPPITPFTEKAEYYPSLFVNDFTTATVSTSTRGFDTASEERRRATLDLAAASGLPQATPLVMSVTTNIPVFSIYAPVYRKDVPTATPDERRAAVQGFIAAGFRIQRLFDGIAQSPIFNRTVHLAVYDAPSLEGASTTTLLYATGDRVPDDVDALSRSLNVVVEGRVWTLSFDAPTDFSSEGFDRAFAPAVLFGGLALSLLVTWVLYAYARSRRVAIDLATRLTADLQASNKTISIERDRLNQIIDAIGDGVTAADMTGRYTLLNDVSVRMFGHAQEDSSDPSKWTKRYETYRADGVTPLANDEIPMVRALKGLDTDKMEMVIKNAASPEGVFVSVTGRPVRDAQGSVVGGVIVMRDMAHEHAIDQAKSEFVSLASHQLRTPPTIINYYADMLLAGDAGKLSDQQREFVTEIEGAGKRMVELVHALLNTTRIELGTLSIRPESLDLRSLADSAIKELRDEVTRKKLTVTVDAPPDLPRLMADPGMLFLVFQNLISNAVRYTPDAGTVKVALSVSGKDVLISVADSGLGIPAAEQQKIFTKLYRADNARKYVAQGTGLGLYLVKSILDKTDGTIRFESAEGTGTTFYVTLPLSGMKPQDGRTQVS